MPVSRDQVLPDPPRRLSADGCVIGCADLGVDLVAVVPVVADRCVDPAGIEGEYVGGGIQRRRAAFVYLTQEFDDLPDVRAVGQRGPASGRTSLKVTPGWSAIRRPSSTSRCARDEVLAPVACAGGSPRDASPAAVDERDKIFPQSAWKEFTEAVKNGGLELA